MSTRDWLAQLSRLNFFAGQLVEGDDDDATQALAGIRLLANSLESMVQSRDVCVVAPAPTAMLPQPPFALPRHGLKQPHARSGGGTDGAAPVRRLAVLRPKPASPARYPAQLEVRFDTPQTFDNPPPDPEANRLNRPLSVVVLREVSPRGGAPYAGTRLGINPCLPVTFKGFAQEAGPECASCGACLPKDPFSPAAVGREQTGHSPKRRRRLPVDSPAGVL